MAYGNVKYVGDGKTKVFSIPFPYLDITHVKVYVNGVLQNDVTYPTESQVELPVAPAAGAVVAVVRETPKERIVDFQNASILDEKTLDLDSNQMMYVVQESLDKSEESLVVDVDNAYDAQGRRIKNLADPQDDQDAVTKRFADQVLAQAQANADAARASAQAAQAAESNAKSHRDTALAAANTATSAANQAVTEVNNAVNKIRDEGDTQVARTIHEGDTQVARVQAEGNIQIANAKQQADRAENEANRAKAIADSLDIEDDFYTHLAAFDAHVANTNNLIGTLRHQAAIHKPEGGKLWHFDTSLESTDGIKPLEGAVATLRPNEGRFGGAVAVEEGTTNLVPSSLLKFEGWVAKNDAQVTLTQNVEFPEIGRNDATRIRTTGGTHTLKYYTDIELSIADQAYTGSVYIKNIGSKPVRFRTQLGPEVTVNPGEWTRAVVSGIGNGTSNFQLRFEALNVDDDLDFIAWGPQGEYKPFATSFVDGTRPDGILAYPIALKDDYTIACYRKSHTDEDYKHVVKRSDGKVFVDGVEDSEYDIGWLAGRNLIQTSWLKNNSDIDYSTGLEQSSGNRTIITEFIPVTPRQTYMLQRPVDQGNVGARYYDSDKNYMGAENLGSGRVFKINIPDGCYYFKFIDEANTLDEGYFVWGYGDDWLMFSDQTGLIDELLILPYAATEEEIKGWYEAKKPFIDQDEISTIDQNLKDSIPPGVILAYAGNTVPDGWKECNGQALSRTTYSRLFSVIGTTYGAGDGQTTFNVPDLRGEFIRGWDNGRGVDSGRTLGSSQKDALQQLSGQVYSWGYFYSASGVFEAVKTDDKGGYGGNLQQRSKLVFDASNVARTASETRPRNIAMKYIIKV